MNKKIYKALKTDAFETIKFICTDSKILEKVNANTSRIKLNGTLNLTGELRNVKVILNLKQGSDNIILEGEMTLNMRDYNIEPPKALFGTVKVNEIVNVTFKTILK